MSSVAVGVFSIAGALLGTLVGLFGERALRRRGEVHRELSAWVGGSRGGSTEYRDFEVRFFNDKDLNIAVWDPTAEFYKGNEKVASFLLQRPRSQGPVGPIDLPSRTSVYETLRVIAGDQALTAVKDADRGRFVARVVPGNKRISGPLPLWEPLELASADSLRE